MVVPEPGVGYGFVHEWNIIIPRWRGVMNVLYWLLELMPELLESLGWVAGVEQVVRVEDP